MNELIHKNSNLASIEKIIIENKEWPFEGYTQEILNLSDYLNKNPGKKQYLGTVKFNGADSIICTPCIIVPIDPNCIGPDSKNSLYPHSLFFSDGSAMNFNKIVYLGIEDRVKDYITKLDSFFIAWTRDLSILEKLNSNDITYRNLLLFAGGIKESIKTHQRIDAMIKDKRARDEMYND